MSILNATHCKITDHHQKTPTIPPLAGRGRQQGRRFDIVPSRRSARTALPAPAAETARPKNAARPRASDAAQTFSEP